jgi:hypothetical protein
MTQQPGPPPLTQVPLVLAAVLSLRHERGATVGGARG